MTHFRIATLSIFAATAGMISGCASTPDPAKVCTAEWIMPRAEKAVDRIEDRTASSLKALSSAGKSWAKGKKPNAFKLLALSSSVNKLERELTEGRGIKDLRMLARTCDDPKIVSKSVRNMLDKYGVPDRLMNMMEGSPIFDRVMGDLAKTPDNEI